MEKRYCEHCNGPLRLIGYQRKNGRINQNYPHDWESRRFHKKCYKEFLLEEKIFKNLFKSD